MRVVFLIFVACLVAILLAWWCTDVPPGAVPMSPDAPGAAPARASLATVGGAGGSSEDASADRELVRLAAPGAASEGAIRGVVTGADGRAIAGAVVGAETSEAEGYPLLDAGPRQRRSVASARTGADGSYALELATGSTCVVRVQAPGFAPAARGDCRPGSTVDFRLEPGATLVGTVRRLADGAPVEGTRIRVSRALGTSAPWMCGEATSDAAGYYRVADLPPGPCSVAVEPRRLAAPRDAEILLHAGHTATHDVALTDGITIRGRVLDAATRAPIAGASVAEGWRGRRATSGADGAFELPGFAAHDNMSLAVEAGGYAPLDVVLRDGGDVADTRTDVEVLLRRGRQASGRVLDEEQRPLGDVYVAAVAADASARFFRYDWRAGRTAADGTFVLDRLRPELAHELLLLRRGLATAVYEFPADESERATIELGDFVMRRPSSVAGRVVDENGRAVADHEVTLWGANADRRRSPGADGYRAIDSYVAERRCRTDADGRFAFADVAAGDHEIRTSRFDSHELVVERRTVGCGEAVIGIEVRLFRGSALEGSVFVADGGPLPKCYCSIDPEDGQGTSADVEVAADGRFRATGLAAGSYSVTVYPYPSDADRAVGRGFASHVHRAVAAGATGLRFEVPVSGPLRGSVLDALRAPLAGAAVGAIAGDELLASATTDESGTFVLTVPCGRTVRVMVCAPGANGEPPIFDRARSVAGAEGAAGGPPLEIVLRR